MAETYVGEVRNGVVVFEGGPPPLPEGAKVRVELVQPPARPKTLAERYAAIIGIAEGLPPDLAEEHDHYIHGTPRRAEEWWPCSSPTLPTIWPYSIRTTHSTRKRWSKAGLCSDRF